MNVNALCNIFDIIAIYLVDWLIYNKLVCTETSMEDVGSSWGKWRYIEVLLTSTTASTKLLAEGGEDDAITKDQQCRM